MYEWVVHLSARSTSACSTSARSRSAQFKFRAMEFQRKHTQNSIYYPHNSVDTLVNTVYTTLIMA